MSFRISVVFCAALILATSALGQPPAAKLPDWSKLLLLRPAGQNGCVIEGTGLMITADGIDVFCSSLQFVIQQTYLIREPGRILGVPEWAKSNMYEVVAKSSGSDVAEYSKLSDDDKNRILRSLLADRFHLKVHMERREMPIFELVIAEGGPKLKEPTAGEENKPGWLFGIPGENFRGVDLPLTELAWMLNVRGLDRTVVDKTGLTGKYDFALHYLSAAKAATDTSGEPTVFTALEEQLGLKLESATAPLDVLVIDSIDQPTAN